jgi:hypothetical protein
VGLIAPRDQAKSLKKGALLMSEEINNQEPGMLPVFTMKTQKQLNVTAKEGSKPNFVLDPETYYCPWYHPGHNFHWIPIFNHSQPRIPIEARWLEGKAFEVVVEGKTAVWYHHRPERLKQAISKAQPGDIKATVGRPWIFISTGDGAYAFNCDEEPIKDCPTKNDSEVSKNE